jgi:hypothetical protein
MFGGGLLSLYIYIHTYIYIYIYIYICICIYMYLLTTLLEAPHQLRKRKGNGAKSVISSQHFGAKLTTNTTHTHTHTHTHTTHTQCTDVNEVREHMDETLCKKHRIHKIPESIQRKGKQTTRQHQEYPSQRCACAIVCDGLLCLLCKVNICTQILIAGYPPQNSSTCFGGRTSDQI